MNHHEMFKTVGNRLETGIPEDPQNAGIALEYPSKPAPSFGNLTEYGWEEVSFRRSTEDIDAIPLRIGKNLLTWTDWSSTGNCPVRITERKKWYFCLFVSHPWFGKGCVDKYCEDGKRLSLLPEIVEMVRYVGLQCCQALLHEARLKQYPNAPASMRQLFKRFSSFVRGALADLVTLGASDKDILEHLENNIGVWIDYEVIPQKPHSLHCRICGKQRRTALASISSIARMSITVLVGCDEQKGASRGWILHETTVSLTSDTVFIWDPILKDIRLLNLVPRLHQLLDRTAKFTNHHDGHSLRVMQFAMICLEPNCWFRHAVLLCDAGGVLPGDVPTTAQWRTAMKHPIHFQIRHENPLEKCIADGDTRVLCRMEIEKVIKRGISYEPDFSEILENERKSGYTVFPKYLHQEIDRACDLRGEIFRICCKNIKSLLKQDHDVWSEFAYVGRILAEMCRLMPQWRIRDGSVVLDKTDKYIRKEWLQIAG